MATGIALYPNIDTTDPTNYPAGNIKDDPLGLIGTPVNVLTTADIHQTFYRALERSGITPNGDPENVGNGYQYATAFGLEAWINLSNTLVYTQDSGTITIGGGDIIYNRYRLHGRTFQWQIQLRTVTIASAPSTLIITLPAAITGAGLTFLNDNGHLPAGFYSAYQVLRGTLQVTGGYGANTIELSTGAPFTNGVSEFFDIDITCELG